MTRSPSHNLVQGTRGFVSVGAYEMGFRYCKNCEEWVHETDQTKLKVDKKNGLRHNVKGCGRLLRRTPKLKLFKERYHWQRGTKWID